MIRLLEGVVGFAGHATQSELESRNNIDEYGDEDVDG